MNDINWYSIAINSSISFILSLIMFSFGVRSGKERTERLKLRDKYRELYAHFSKLRNGILEYKPLDWDDFRDSNSWSSKPPCKEMVKNGEHLELSKSLFPALEELETNSLRYGSFFYDLSNKSGELILEVLGKHGVETKSENHSVSTNIDKSVKNSGGFFEVNPATLISPDIRSKWLGLVKERETGLCFTRVENSRVLYRIYLRECDVKYINIEEILIDIAMTLDENKDEYLNKREDLVVELDSYLQKLSGLTREPHSFWSTLGNTFKDFTR
ncbi:hypothetical protein M3664_04685 [Paenibacillus lautus]|uniref:hypothetical protein n=1 Tax=Paenibacillus lautus TaxID=1401 RepID=UPI00203E1020|nr:hypothetical protein [Paenibacillus lautus]MCM3257078.1 hypothetical protein [Paenibacillus lautus]